MVVEVVTEDGPLNLVELGHRTLQNSWNMSILELRSQVDLAVVHKIFQQLIHLPLVADVQLPPTMPLIDDHLGLAVCLVYRGPVDYRDTLALRHPKDFRLLTCLV